MLVPLPWILEGTERKNRFEERLTPENLAWELDEYQEVFGDSFGLDELLRLEQIRSNALIAEAINDAPEFLLDQVGIMRNTIGMPTIGRSLRDISETLERISDKD